MNEHTPFWGELLMAKTSSSPGQGISLCVNTDNPMSRFFHSEAYFWLSHVDIHGSRLGISLKANNEVS